MTIRTGPIALSTLSSGLVALVLSAPSSHAQNSQKQDVPGQLFGITVGKDYSLGNPENGDFGNFPVKKFTGMQKFLGSGISYYFEPTKVNPAFEYIELKEKPEDKFFRTSFRAYLFPVIPPDVQTMKALEKQWGSLEHRVALVEWRKEMPNEDDSYLAALDWCATFTATMSAAPKISDRSQTGPRWYSCEFTSGDHTLEARNISDALLVSLSLRRDLREKIDEEVEQRIRSLQGKDLLE